MKLLSLSRAGIAACFGMWEAVAAMETAFAALSRGDIEASLRTALLSKDGTMFYKATYSPGLALFCVKVVSVFKSIGNASQDPVCAAEIDRIARAGSSAARSCFDRRCYRVSGIPVI